jgi:DNA-binding NarL/FixJ family response regulator
MVDVWIMAATAARRDWLLRTLNPDRSIRVAGMAATFPFLRSLMLESSADLALVDVQSQQESTVVRDWLLELLERVSIVLLSSEPDPVIFRRILHTGVGGMLQAEASSEKIVQAIKSVTSGLMVFDSVFVPQRPDHDLPAELLTPRENEVLRWLADGLGNKEIAARLNISEHTIKFHIRSILGKLGASSRTEAVSRGLRSGLIEM